MLKIRRKKKHIHKSLLKEKKIHFFRIKSYIKMIKYKKKKKL